MDILHVPEYNFDPRFADLDEACESARDFHQRADEVRRRIAVYLDLSEHALLEAKKLLGHLEVIHKQQGRPDRERVDAAHPTPGSDTH